MSATYCLKGILIAVPIALHASAAYADNLHLYMTIWHLIHLFGHLIRIEQELNFHCFFAVALRVCYGGPILEFYDWYWITDMYVTFVWISATMLVNLALKILVGHNVKIDSCITVVPGTPFDKWFTNTCYLLNLSGLSAVTVYIVLEEEEALHHTIQIQECTANFTKCGSNRKKNKQKSCVICHGAMLARQEVTLLSCFSTHRYHTQCIVRHWDTQLEGDLPFTCPLCNAQVQGLSVGVKVS